MDRLLRVMRWQRLCLDDLKGESNKAAVRFICLGANLGTGGIPIIAMVDAHAWIQGDKVRMELARPDYPRILEHLVASGLEGTSPIAMGFAPCLHEPWHWNPLCLPLSWEPSMDNRPVFTALMRRYKLLVDNDSSWQCPNYLPFVR